MLSSSSSIGDRSAAKSRAIAWCSGDACVSCDDEPIDGDNMDMVDFLTSTRCMGGACVVMIRVADVVCMMIKCWITYVSIMFELMAHGS